MRSIGSVRRERRIIWRPFPGSAIGPGLVLLFALAGLASPHTFFPFFPLFVLVLVLSAMRMIKYTAARRRGAAAVRLPADDPPTLPPSETVKEKELLEALERCGEITAVRAALETSLSVAEAEEMLSALANNGHMRVIANEGRLTYALWV